jgi:ABC-type lipoprotein export system ATPase subunit
LEIEKLTIFGGVGKKGDKELVEKIELRMGEVISIVGPTGSGKTEFINDIELFANDNTPSKRRILINDLEPSEEFLAVSKNPIALITQHTNFLSDLPVNEFLKTHASIRRKDSDDIIKETLDFANQLTGEPIIETSGMTELSGGQTRALLIADAVIIGNSPIILLDEIENAGINRTRAIELLKGYRKIFVFVTHDPRIALQSDYRVIMKAGAMQKVMTTDEDEKKAVEEIKKLDDIILDLRAKIRNGNRISHSQVKEQLRIYGYMR